MNLVGFGVWDKMSESFLECVECSWSVWVCFIGKIYCTRHYIEKIKKGVIFEKSSKARLNWEDGSIEIIFDLKLEVECE